MPGARFGRILVAIVTILLVVTMVLGSALQGINY